MPRPIKCRRIAFIPGIDYFKPAGIPLRFLGEVCLTLEEAETMRLKDLEDLDQEQCAARMNISRPTFQRVLDSARKKVSDALLNGKAIKIEGGHFEMITFRYKCDQGHEWDMPFDQVVKGSHAVCPVCGTSATVPLQPVEVWDGRGWGRCHMGKFSRC